MYRWIWDRLPGPVAARAAIAAAAVAGVVALIVLVISPLLRPADQTSGDDGIQVGFDDVAEPDGVRSSPRPSPEQPDPTPIVPEDIVPQQ